MNWDSTFYAGLSGLTMPVDSYNLGDGISIQRTYAHIMAPMMMAFKKPDQGMPHAAPWKAIQTGVAIDIEAEIIIPSSFQPDTGLDRLNTVWWIAALIRLIAAPCVSVPVASEVSLSTISSNPETARVFPLEASSGRSQSSYYPLEEEHLHWVRKHWREGAKLYTIKEDFLLAFQAFDSSSVVGRASLALITIWGALEQLFAPAKQELRFRAAANISAFLEESGEKRLKLHKQILKLYDARSTVAHSAKPIHSDASMHSHALLKRVIKKILEQGRVPTKEDLERLLFGA